MQKQNEKPIELVRIRKLCTVCYESRRCVWLIH